MKVKAKKVKPGPGPGHRFAEANAAVVIAGVEALPKAKDLRRAAIDALVPTDDPNDRAHNVHDHTIDRKLLPARAVGLDRTQPRRYPPCHIIEGQVRGRVIHIAIDSVFDATYQIARELAEAGIELGVVGAARQRDEAVAREDNLRSRTRRKTRQERTPEEKAASAAGTEMLRKKS